jgi:hypothetical protein
LRTFSPFGVVDNEGLGENPKLAVFRICLM